MGIDAAGLNAAAVRTALRAQADARQLLRRQPAGMRRQRLHQEALVGGADPEHEAGTRQREFVGRPQLIMVRRGARRHELAHAAGLAGHRRGDQRKRTDAGQHFDGRGGQRQQSEQ